MRISGWVTSKLDKKSPTAACTAAAERTAAKPAKTSAARAAAKTASHHASPSRAADERTSKASAHPRATTSAGTGRSKEKAENGDDENASEKKKQDDQEDYAAGTGVRTGRLRGRSGRKVRRRRKSDSAIGGDGVRDAAGHEKGGSVVIFVAQIRDSFTANAANLSVGKNGFEAVTDFDTVLTVVHGKKD